MTIRTCVKCDEAIQYMPPTTYSASGTFVHLNGQPDHPAAPKPQCPKCASFDYVHDNTDPWADYSRCGACKYVLRVSLGD